MSKTASRINNKLSGGQNEKLLRLQYVVPLELTAVVFIYLYQVGNPKKDVLEHETAKILICGIILSNMTLYIVS
jgi:hypothetical protein